ncbi:MAG TPA: Gfo/Idh/MocA family oxidoreductase [Trueperaceae bacterium]
MSQLRIGVVGCGFMGSLHAATLAQAANAELAAVFDRDRQAAKKVAEEHAASVADTLEELVAGFELDGLIVATPDDLHAEPVYAAAAAGLAVLVEKPLAHTLSDARQMLAACEEAGTLLMVGHILRFETVYANLRLAVRGGVIGNVVSVFARRHGLRTEAERFKGRAHVIDYLAVHDLDILNWMREDAPVAVTATAAHGIISQRYGTPDVVVSVLQYGDGSIATVESGWTLPTSWNPQRAPAEWLPFGDVRLDVFGEEGMLSLDFRNMNLIGVDEGGWRIPETRHWPRLHGRVTGALREEVGHFLDCLAGNAEPVSTGWSALAAVELCAALHRSLRSSTSEALPLNGSDFKFNSSERIVR